MSVETGFLSLAALVILLALRVPIGVALISIAFCGLLMCTKPVRSAADVKGLRIRAAGHTVPMTTALGASPINVPSSEIYEVLERGPGGLRLWPAQLARSQFARRDRQVHR